MPDYDTPEYDPTKTGVSSPSLTPLPEKSDVTQATATTYEAPKLTVDADKSTVSGQMTGLLSESNPYIKQAQAGAMETANSRGLLNSSIAAGAGQKAAIEAAMPIATQDAQTYGQAQLANQQAQQQALSEGTAATNEAEMANVAAQNRITEAQTQLSAEQQLAQQNAALQEALKTGDFNRELGIMGADAANKERIMEFDANIKTQLAAIQQDYAMELENLSQSYEIQKNLDTSMGTVYDGALKSIATVLQNPDMTSAQSTKAVKVIINNLSAGLNFLSGISTTPKTVGY